MDSNETVAPDKAQKGAPIVGYVLASAPGTEVARNIDVSQIGRIILRQRLVVGGIAAVCTAIAIATAFLMTPFYRSVVLLSPVVEQPQFGLGGVGQLGDLAALAGISVNAGSGEEEAIALLKSRVLIEQFIQEKKLLPILFAHEWDAESNKWDVDHADDVPTLSEAYEKFDRKIRKVEQDKRTGLVTLSIDWKDRALAASWAEELVMRVNRQMRQRAVDEARRSLEFLNQELQRTSLVGLQQVIYRLVETQTQTIMLANVREQYSFRIIDPPVVADEDEYVRPKRALIVVLGIIGGLFLGLGAAVVRDAVSGEH